MTIALILTIIFSFINQFHASTGHFVNLDKHRQMLYLPVFESDTFGGTFYSHY